MTPQEKALELFRRFYKKVQYSRSAKECILIAVEEIIDSHTDNENGDDILKKEYWQQVKEEIEKL